MNLASKVKIDSKIIFSLPQSKTVKQALGLGLINLNLKFEY
jgi:hypothetical protein